MFSGVQGVKKIVGEYQHMGQMADINIYLKLVCLEGVRGLIRAKSNLIWLLVKKFD